MLKKINGDRQSTHATLHVVSFQIEQKMMAQLQAVCIVKRETSHKVNNKHLEVSISMVCWIMNPHNQNWKLVEELYNNHSSIV